MAIYHLLDYEVLDGPKFLRLASRLPLYEGAVRRRLELEQQESSQPTQVESYSSGPQPGQQMSMKEAVARSSGNDIDVLHALNEQHANSSFGALFEYSTAE